MLYEIISIIIELFKIGISNSLAKKQNKQLLSDITQNMIDMEKLRDHPGFSEICQNEDNKLTVPVSKATIFRHQIN